MNRLVISILIVVIALAACGSGDSADTTQSGPQTALRDGDSYTRRNSDGSTETRQWVEGHIIKVNGQYQIVQASDYQGPPVYVDDEYKATMPSCDVPAGTTWTSGDDSGVYQAGELRVIVGAPACVIREAGDSGRPTTDSPTPPPAAPTITAAPTATPPIIEADPEPETNVVASTLLDGFATVDHTTEVSEVAWQMPASFKLDIETNAAFGFDKYAYTFDDRDKYLLFEVTESAGFFTDNEEREYQENVSARAKIGADNFADLLELFYGFSDVERLDTGRAVTADLRGNDAGLPGYEVDMVVGTSSGHVRYFRLDGTIYKLVGIGLSDQEWATFAESFTIEQLTPETEEPDLTDEDRAERAAAVEAVLELTGGQAFVEGPYPRRELDPMTGGWDFLDAPPFGAVEPGQDPELDPAWVGCREGDGFACDTLAIEAEVDSAYHRFGLTCGGRSATESCSTLLGSEPHPGFALPYNDELDFYRNRIGGFRLDRIPGPDSPPPGEDPVRDLLWAQCGIGADNSGCFALSKDRGVIPDVYEAYGMSCGGRRSWESQACFLLFVDETSRVPAGSEPPGLYTAEADRDWTACDIDESECFALSVSSIGVPSDRRDDFRPYGQFAQSCGGEYERPFTELTLSGGCRAPYAAMPAIDDVSTLPHPPE